MYLFFFFNAFHFLGIICIFTNCMFLIAISITIEEKLFQIKAKQLLKKIQFVSKHQDNFKCRVVLLLFCLVLSSSHIYIYIYIYMYIYGTFSICRFLFCQCCENSKCYIYSGGRFLCRSLDLEAVIFCFLVSFSAVYSSFNIQSYFKLVKKIILETNMGIISLFIEVC